MLKTRHMQLSVEVKCQKKKERMNEIKRKKTQKIGNLKGVGKKNPLIATVDGFTACWYDRLAEKMAFQDTLMRKDH